MSTLYSLYSWCVLQNFLEIPSFAEDNLIFGPWLFHPLNPRQITRQEERKSARAAVVYAPVVTSATAKFQEFCLSHYLEADLFISTGCSSHISHTHTHSLQTINSLTLASVREKRREEKSTKIMTVLHHSLLKSKQVIDDLKVLTRNLHNYQDRT